MTIVCIQRDKFGYFPPSQPIVVLPQPVTRVSLPEPQ